MGRSWQGRSDAWLALEPVTGRTHQLRVHCAEMGWPIVGDAIYGKAPRSGGPVLHLHAREVVVPLYKNRAPIRVIAPVPQHMRAALGGMRMESGGAGGGMKPRSRRQQLLAVVRGDFQFNDRAGFGRSREPDRRELLGAALLVRFDQHAAYRADLGIEMPPQCQRAALAQTLRPRPSRSRARSCGMRAAGVPGRGENGKTCRCVSPHSSTRSSELVEHRFGLGREAGDHVGAEHDVRAQPAQRIAERDGIARANAGASCA